MRLKELMDHVYPLSCMPRYSNRLRVRDEDVAQHSFFTAVIVVGLHRYYEFDLGKAILAAICHDITEVDLSDVSHAVKVANEDLKRCFEQAEFKAISKYPRSFREGFYTFLDEGSAESMIAQYADVLQVIQYTEMEIKLGNSCMKDIIQEARTRSVDLRKELKQYERKDRTDFELI